MELENLSSWKKKDLPKLEFLDTGTSFDGICGGIPRKAITVVSGYSGNGKSFALLHLAASLSEKYRILYVSVENVPQIDIDRFNEVPKHYNINSNNIFYWNIAQDGTPYEDITETIKNIIKVEDFDALFIDGGDILMEGEDGAKMYVNGNKLMQEWKMFAEVCNMAVVVSWQLGRESEKKKIDEIGTSDIAQSIGVIRYASLVIAVKSNKKNQEWWLKATKARFNYDYEPYNVFNEGKFDLGKPFRIITQASIAEDVLGF